MTIKELIHKQQNTGHLILLRQGLFFRAFNEGAALLHRVMGYKIKQLCLSGEEVGVFYVGFPANISSTVIERLTDIGGVLIDSESANIIEVQGINIGEGYDVDEMQNLVTPSVSYPKREKDRAKAVPKSVKDSVLGRLIDFDALTSTPVAALNFIVTLQNELRGQ